MLTFENLPFTLVLMLSKFAGDPSITFDYDGRKMWMQSYTIAPDGGTLTFAFL